jgi:hypothetical protein
VVVVVAFFETTEGLTIMSGSLGHAARSAASARCSPSASSRVAPDSQSVILDSTTEISVRELNRVSLSRFRSHSITQDAPPDVDLSALVDDDIPPFNDRVSAELSARDPVLAAAATHFFGAGPVREGKRVRPVMVLLMGNVSCNPPTSSLPSSDHFSFLFGPRAPLSPP